MMTTVAEAIRRQRVKRILQFFLRLGLVVAVLFLTGPRVGTTVQALTPPVLPEVDSHATPQRLEQNWSLCDSQRLHSISQGTTTIPIPLSWLLALEAPQPSLLALPFATSGRFIDDDALLYSYCWEALRFNPINPFVIRRCSKDYRIAAGTLRSATIKAGKTVLVSTRSAMRDGRELPAADSFAIDRPAYHYKHLGYGMHTCLGEHVSRVQVPEVIKRLPKLPGVRPTGPIDFKGGPFPESYVLEFN